MFSIEAIFAYFVLFAVVVGLTASVRILREYEGPSFSPWAALRGSRARALSC